VPIEMTEPLKSECQHFLDCIATGRTPKTDVKEGLRVLEILQASQKSLNQNGCKIHLDNKLKTIPSLPITHDPDPESRDYFVHESSYIDDKVEIGAGTKIWHFSHVLAGSKIGEKSNIGQNVVVGPDVSIGSGCKIQNNVSVYKGVTLEDKVFCGPSMVFTNVYNPRSAIRRMDELLPTLVRKGATIGANATILCGITVGRYAFVGAGAVVLKDVLNHALVVGNPAKQKGWMCECGERIDNKLVCAKCMTKYKKTKTGLRKLDKQV
jgi:UDP-2-acetamido-3-amino-2,3-dideoxy-glucuronate N-acetyltransferase